MFNFPNSSWIHVLEGAIFKSDNISCGCKCQDILDHDYSYATALVALVSGKEIFVGSSKNNKAFLHNVGGGWETLRLCQGRQLQTLASNPLRDRYIGKRDMRSKISLEIYEHKRKEEDEILTLATALASMVIDL